MLEQHIQIFFHFSTTERYSSQQSNEENTIQTSQSSIFIALHSYLMLSFHIPSALGECLLNLRAINIGRFACGKFSRQMCWFYMEEIETMT